MPQPYQTEILTASELLAIREALANAALMTGLSKIFEFDSRYHAESARNESLSVEPNLSRIIQYSARTLASHEWLTTIKVRMEVLTQRQRNQP
jgi:hypothetical protein